MRKIPLIALSLLASPAAAEVVSAGPNGFHVRQSVQIVIPTGLGLFRLRPSLGLVE